MASRILYGGIGSSRQALRVAIMRQARKNLWWITTWKFFDIRGLEADIVVVIFNGFSS